MHGIHVIDYVAPVFTACMYMYIYIYIYIERDMCIIYIYIHTYTVSLRPDAVLEELLELRGHVVRRGEEVHLGAITVYCAIT